MKIIAAGSIGPWLVVGDATIASAFNAGSLHDPQERSSVERPRETRDTHLASPKKAQKGLDELARPPLLHAVTGENER